MLDIYLEYIKVQFQKAGISLRSETGANAVEYILIALLIAIGLFVAFRLLGQQISDVAGDITSRLGG